MKKFFAILMALTLCLPLASCAKKPAPASADASDTSWDYIKNNGKLIIGLDDTFAPMGFRDESGKLVGFDIDLATAACKELGIEPVFQPIDWNSKELELDGKKIDCIWNGLSITPDRQKAMSMTKPYLNNSIVIMTVDGVTITTTADLAKYNVGTQSESSALDALKADPNYASFKDKLHEYPTYDECIMDMQAGRIDAMVVDEVYGMYKNSKLEKPFTVSPCNFGEDLYGVGFRKDDLALTAKVEDAIASLISSGKAAEISKTWFGQDIIYKG